MSDAEAGGPGPSPTASRFETICDVLLVVAFVAFAASIALQRIRSLDYWWHLRTGKWIVENGAVPRVDSYTYTVEGAQWIDIHWLHQLGLYAVHALGGHDAVSIAKLALVLLLVFVVGSVAFRRGRGVITAAVLALVLLAAGDRFMPRPELPTFILLAGVLALLDRFERRGDAWVYGIVALQLVWANVHGLFALGIAVCAMFVAAEVLRPWLTPGVTLRPERLRRLLAVVALSCLASLANPNFLDGAFYPFQQLGMIGPTQDRGVFGTAILELHPTIGGMRPAGAAQTTIFGALAALSFAAMLVNWRRLHPADPLLWVSFGYLALGAQRNLALFAIVAAFVLLRNVNDLLDHLRWGTQGRGWSVAAGVGALFLGVLAVDTASGRLSERLGSAREPGLGIADHLHPKGAVDWIETNRPAGPVAHHMADGGYLIWRLHPGYRVMTDGRLEVFGADRFVDLTITGPDAFRRLDAEYQFGVVLLHHSLEYADGLLLWLERQPRWRLTFVDDVAAVFVRAAADGRFDVPAIDIGAVDLFGGLGEEPSYGARMRRIARTNFYASAERYEEALELWTETLALYPNIVNGRIVYASLLQQTGRGAAAEAILVDALADQPGDVALILRVGDLRLENGDLERARVQYEAALALDAESPDAQYRMGLVAEREGDPRAAALRYLRVVNRIPVGHPAAARAAARLRALGAGGAR